MLLCSLVALGTLLFAEPLFSNGCCIVAGSGSANRHESKNSTAKMHCNRGAVFSVRFVLRCHKQELLAGVPVGEPRHRKCKRLKLGAGQAYDRSSD
jgi:hypothetical protein